MRWSCSTWCAADGPGRGGGWGRFLVVDKERGRTCLCDDNNFTEAVATGGIFRVYNKGVVWIGVFSSRYSVKEYKGNEERRRMAEGGLEREPTARAPVYREEEVGGGRGRARMRYTHRVSRWSKHLLY